VTPTSEAGLPPEISLAVQL